MVSHLIALLMVNDEDDILGRTIQHNSQWFDAFYVLDGSSDNTLSEKICRTNDKCWAYRTDDQLPRPPFPEKSVCGYRKFIHDLAVADHGPDHWFMILHADEVWPFDPRPYTRQAIFDGFVFNLPFFFPREPWDYCRHPIDQLTWSLGPGWPEFRLFKGSEGVSYDATQRFNAAPRGLRSTFHEGEDKILHYPYRSPEVQRARAATHERTQFDQDNYQHIINDDACIWTDEMIQEYRRRPEFRDIREQLLVAA